MTKVVVADDHQIICDSIVELAKSSGRFVVAATVGDGERALEACRIHKPNLLLLDLEMPRMNGLETAAVLRAEMPTQKFAALTMFAEHMGYIRQLFDLGARGYIVKSQGLKTVLTAIKEIETSGYYVTSESYPYIAGPLPEKYREARRISPRELEVLELLSENLNNEQIAERLGIAVRTVENHRHRMHNRTGQTNLASLLLYAHRQGLIKLSSLPSRKLE
jgi:two-component system secretion response regulator SsrB